MIAPAQRSKRLFIAVIFMATALHLSGCCQGRSAAITPVDPAVLAAIVLYLRRSRGWDFGPLTKTRPLLPSPSSEPVASIATEGSLCDDALSASASATPIWSRRCATLRTGRTLQRNLD